MKATRARKTPQEKSQEGAPPEPEGAAAKSKRPLERYVQLLEAIATYQDKAGLPDLANILGLPKTTIYRLLRGLEESQLVSAGQGRGAGYTLAPRLLRVIHLSDTGYGIEAYTGVHLQELSEATGLTSFIAKLQGTSVRSVAMRTPNALSGIYVVPGSEMPPHASASAKAILAHQPDATIDGILAGPLPKLTRYTITSAKKLAGEYRKVKAEGYSTCISEDVEGIGALACPIVLPEIGVIYSVGITGPVETVIGDHTARLVQALQASAGKLSAAIMSGERLMRK
jgi:DNA-binding IclR family transcriptional regulator